MFLLIHADDGAQLQVKDLTDDMKDSSACGDLMIFQKLPDGVFQTFDGEVGKDVWIDVKVEGDSIG